MANNLVFDFLLPFAEAIAQAEGRDVMLDDEYYGDIATAARAQAFTVSYLASVQQVAGILTTLGEALAKGQTFDMWKDSLGPEAESLTDPHLETVYRNAFQTAYNAGRMKQQAKNAMLRPYLMYDAINDSRTRPNHAALDNFIAPVGAPVWSRIYPPNGHNCFLPGTVIAGAIVAASKARYAGEAVEIETQAGARLSVTINHPIATPHGFIAAGKLAEGDYCLSDGAELKLVPLVRAPQATGRAIADQQGPAFAEDVFDALAAHGTRSVQVAPLDFHGDAAGFDGQINVAVCDGVLMADIEASGRNAAPHDQFARADAGGVAILGGGELGELVRSAHPASGRAMGSGDLSGSGLGGHAGPFQGLRLGPSANRYPKAPEVAGDGGSAYAEFARKLVDGSSGSVFADKIVRVSRFPYSGHVFDFQTVSGAICASGIVTHNCRCAVMSLTMAQAKARGWSGQLEPTDGGPDEGWDHPPSDAFATNVDLLRRAADGAGVALQRLAGNLADAAERMQKGG